MTSTEFYGSGLALGVAAVALGLLAWQWAQRRGRGADLPAEDAAHFSLQDVRHGALGFLLLALSAGVYAGSTTPPRVGGRPNLVFVETWLAVSLLILVLLALAVLDWAATRRYAARRRRAIVREGLDILRDEIRLQADRGRGRAVDGDGAPRPEADGPGPFLS